MALRYSGTTIGRLTLVQNGNKFPIQIRQSNCLAAFLHIYKEENPENPELPWRHNLLCFFVDEPHLKRCLKDGDFESIFWGKLKNIRLNIYYKEMITLAKYLTKDGYKVTCYYKEPKIAKKKLKVTIK